MGQKEKTANAFMKKNVLQQDEDCLKLHLIIYIVDVKKYCSKHNKVTFFAAYKIQYMHDVSA